MASLRISPIIILILLSFASANDTYMNYDYRTGAVFPLNNENIKMVKEIVKYDYRNYEFNTTFWMKNTTAQSQNVTIGFPLDPDIHKYPEDYQFGTGFVFNEHKFMNEIEQDFNFQTWINDKEITREIMKIEPNSSGFKYAFVTNISFKPNEELIIKNKYKQKMGTVSNTIGLREVNLKYIPTTGAAWKDSIDHAYFEFIVPKKYNLRKDDRSEFTGSYPQGILFYTKYFEKPLNEPEPTKIEIKDSLCVLTWEYENLEPDFNILFRHKIWSEQFGNWFIDFNKHTLFLSEDIINSSKDNSKFNEKIAAFQQYLQAKNLEIFDDLTVCRKFVKYYVDQMIENNAYMKTNDKYHEVRKKFVTNFIYALYGYDFKNDQWKKLFECFKWYKPTSTAPVLPDDEQIMVDRIKNL